MPAAPPAFDFAASVNPFGDEVDAFLHDFFDAHRAAVLEQLAQSSRDAQVPPAQSRFSFFHVVTRLRTHGLFFTLRTWTLDAWRLFAGIPAAEEDSQEKIRETHMAAMRTLMQAQSSNAFASIFRFGAFSLPELRRYVPELRRELGLESWWNLAEVARFFQRIAMEDPQSTLAQTARTAYAGYAQSGLIRDDMHILLTRVFEEAPMRLCTYIQNQAESPLRALVELVSNAVDAHYPGGKKIGRFGVGFYQSLAFALGDPQAEVEVDTRHAEDKPLRLRFRSTAKGDMQVRPEASQRVKTGSTVRVKKHLTAEQQKALRDYLVEHLAFNTRAVLMVDGEYINQIHNLNYINGGRIELAGLPVIEINISANGFEVIDHGVGMRIQDAFEKLLVPKESGKREETLVDEAGAATETRLFYSDPVPAGQMTRCRAQIQISGVKIESFEFAGVDLPEHFILELPPDSWVPESRNQIEVNPAVIAGFKAMVAKVLTRAEIQPKAPLINALGALARELQKRNSTDDNLESALKVAVEAYYQNKKIHLAPNQPDFLRLAWAQPGQPVEFLHHERYEEHGQIKTSSVFDYAPAQWGLQPHPHFVPRPGSRYQLFIADFAPHEPDTLPYFVYGDHIFMSRAFFERYQHEAAVLNEVLNFQVDDGESVALLGEFRIPTPALQSGTSTPSGAETNSSATPAFDPTDRFAVRNHQVTHAIAAKQETWNSMLSGISGPDRLALQARLRRAEIAHMCVDDLDTLRRLYVSGATLTERRQALHQWPTSRHNSALLSALSQTGSAEEFDALLQSARQNLVNEMQSGALSSAELDLIRRAQQLTGLDQTLELLGYRLQAIGKIESDQLKVFSTRNGKYLFSGDLSTYHLFKVSGNALVEVPPPPGLEYDILFERDSHGICRLKGADHKYTHWRLDADDQWEPVPAGEKVASTLSFSFLDVFFRSGENDVPLSRGYHRRGRAIYATSTGNKIYELPIHVDVDWIHPIEPHEGLMFVQRDTALKHPHLYHLTAQGVREVDVSALGIKDNEIFFFYPLLVGGETLLAVRHVDVVASSFKGVEEEVTRIRICRFDGEKLVDLSPEILKTKTRKTLPRYTFGDRWYHSREQEDTPKNSPIVENLDCYIVTLNGQELLQIDADDDTFFYEFTGQEFRLIDSIPRRNTVLQTPFDHEEHLWFGQTYGLHALVDGTLVEVPNDSRTRYYPLPAETGLAGHWIKLVGDHTYHMAPRPNAGEALAQLLTPAEEFIAAHATLFAAQAGRRRNLFLNLAHWAAQAGAQTPTTEQLFWMTVIPSEIYERFTPQHIARLQTLLGERGQDLGYVLQVMGFFADLSGEPALHQRFELYFDKFCDLYRHGAKGFEQVREALEKTYPDANQKNLKGYQYLSRKPEDAPADVAPFVEWLNNPDAELLEEHTDADSFWEGTPLENVAPQSLGSLLYHIQSHRKTFKRVRERLKDKAPHQPRWKKILVDLLQKLLRLPGTEDPVAILGQSVTEHARRKVSEQILQTIGSQDHSLHIWIRELVQNARDAMLQSGAAGQTIVMNSYLAAGRWIFSVSDPAGMDLHTVLNYLLVPDETTKLRGDAAGIFGQGFFTVFQGADEVLLKTSTGNGIINYLALKAHYETAADGSKKLADITVERLEQRSGHYKGSEVRRVIDADSATLPPSLEANIVRHRCQRYVGVVDRVAVTLNAVPVNAGPVETLASVATPWGNLSVLTAHDHHVRLTKERLYINEVSREKYRPFVPEWLWQMLAAQGAGVDLPAGLTLTRTRNALAGEDSVLPELQKCVAVGAYQALLRLYLQGQLEIPGIPADYLHNPIREEMFIRPDIATDAAKINHGLWSQVDFESYQGADNKYRLIELLLGLEVDGVSLTQMRGAIQNKHQSKALDALSSALGSSVHGAQVMTAVAAAAKAFNQWQPEDPETRARRLAELQAEYAPELEALHGMSLRLLDAMEAGHGVTVEWSYNSKTPDLAHVDLKSKTDAIVFNLANAENLLQNLRKISENKLAPAEYQRFVRNFLNVIAHEFAHVMEKRRYNRRDEDGNIVGLKRTHQRDREMPESFRVLMSGNMARVANSDPALQFWYI